MGLIKAAIGAVGSTLHDQWKEVISCENMDNDTLMKQVTTDTGVITKNSLIRVMPGQCAVIMQNGKVLDASAVEGDYTFDESTSPSFFAGQFGDVFKEMWQRFTFGGDAANRQSVFYFNTKEILDNKFGTANPVPFQDWSHPVPNQMTGGVLPLAVKVKCFGKYTFKIADPALFMKEVAGTAVEYKKDQIVEQMRSEVVGTFQNVLNELGTEKYKVPVLELPSQTEEIKQIMDSKVFDDQIRRRGLTIVGFIIESVTLDEKSEEYINNYILSANAQMQQGTLVGSYSQAVKDAANNANGAAAGVMGIGMMNMAGNGVFGAATQNAAAGAAASAQAVSQQQAQQATQPVQETKKDTWKCPKCGKENDGKFCNECGEKKPEAAKCSNCGKDLPAGTKFCPECGTKVGE